MTILSFLPVIIIAVGFLALLIWAATQYLGKITRNTIPASDDSQLVDHARSFLSPVVQRFGFSEPVLQSLNYLLSEGTAGELHVKIEGTGTGLNKDQFALIQIVLKFPSETAAETTTQRLSEEPGISLRRPPLMKKNSRVWVPGSDVDGDAIAAGLERIAEINPSESS